MTKWLLRSVHIEAQSLLRLLYVYTHPRTRARTLLHTHRHLLTITRAPSATWSCSGRPQSDDAQWSHTCGKCDSIIWWECAILHGYDKYHSHWRNIEMRASVSVCKHRTRSYRSRLCVCACLYLWTMLMNQFDFYRHFFFSQHFAIALTLVERLFPNSVTVCSLPPSPLSLSRFCRSFPHFLRACYNFFLYSFKCVMKT